MLAKKRCIKQNGSKVSSTPFFIPSFSSKADVDLQVTYNAISNRLTDPFLISAYDLHYEHFKANALVDHPLILFIDSGGYETLIEPHLPGEPIKKDYTIEPWNSKMYVDTVKKLNYLGPHSMVSFDHPDLRQSMEEQIKSAKQLFDQFPDAIKEFLIKPTSKEKYHLSIEEIKPHIDELSQFDIIGVTDKELGNSFIERLQSVANLRRALIDSELEEMPIHIFGNLDTVTSPLYFLAGADIFDGLSWLKFSFHKGNTVYTQTINVLKDKVTENYYNTEAMNLIDNILELNRLKSKMKLFLKSDDLKEFEFHHEIFRKIINQVDFE